MKVDAIFQEIEEESSTKIKAFCQKIEDNLLQLKSMVNDMIDNTGLVRSARLAEAQDVLHRAEVEKDRLKEQVKEAVEAERSGKSPAMSFNHLNTELQGGVLGDSEILKFKLSFEIDLRNMKTMKAAQDEGVIVSNNERLPDNMGHQFVLYTRLFGDQEEQQQSEMHRQCLVQLKECEKGRQGSSSRFYWIDHDLLGQEGKVRIEEKMNGNRTPTNVYQDFYNDLKQNLIDMALSGTLTQDQEHMIELQVRCPSAYKGICQATLRQWKCSICKGTIKFGVDTTNETGIVTCMQCNRAYYQGASIPFRCNSDDHGYTYQKYDNGKAFQEQTRCFIEQIMQKHNEEQNMKEFSHLNLDGDGKLTWTEAQPIFQKLDELSQRVHAVKVIEFFYPFRAQALDIQTNHECLLANT